MNATFKTINAVDSVLTKLVATFVVVLAAASAISSDNILIILSACPENLCNIGKLNTFLKLPNASSNNVLKFLIRPDSASSLASLLIFFVVNILNLLAIPLVALIFVCTDFGSFLDMVFDIDLTPLVADFTISLSATFCTIFLATVDPVLIPEKRFLSSTIIFDAAIPLASPSINLDRSVRPDFSSVTHCPEEPSITPPLASI